MGNRYFTQSRDIEQYWQIGAESPLVGAQNILGFLVLLSCRNVSGSVVGQWARFLTLQRAQSCIPDDMPPARVGANPSSVIPGRASALRLRHPRKFFSMSLLETGRNSVVSSPCVGQHEVLPVVDHCRQKHRRMFESYTSHDQCRPQP